MRKRRFAIFLAILLALTLSACGKVGDTKEAIAAIGPVTMESENAICAAETLFADLSPRQQARVKNRDVLDAARAEYTRLTQEVDQMVAAIDALSEVTLASKKNLEDAEALFASLTDNQKEYIPNADALTDARKEFDRQAYLVKKAVDYIENLGEITMSSEEALVVARSAYSDVVNEGLGVYVQHVYSILTDAEERFTYLGLENRLDTVRDMYSQGVYDAALEQALVLITDCQKTTLLSKAKTLAADCIVAKAREAFEADDLENAYYQLLSSDELYPTEERPEAYTLLQEEITATLEKRRPANGKVLKSKYTYSPSGNGHEVIVQAPEEHDVCVKLERVGDASMCVIFYVRAGEKAKVNVYHGNYYIKYAMGEHWFGIDSLFGELGVYVQAKEPFEFYTYLQGNYKYYVGLSLTIGYAIDGETDGQEIPREGF